MTLPAQPATLPVPNDDDVKVARLIATEFTVDDFPRPYLWTFISRCGVVVVMTTGYANHEHFFLPANFTSIDLLTTAVRVYEAGWRAGHRRGTEYGKGVLRNDLRRLIGASSDG